MILDPADGRFNMSASLNMLLQRRLSIVLYAGVLVKALLRHAIEGERGDGALQAWRDYAPRAMGATPACEVFVFGPNHVSHHRYLWIVDFGGRSTSAGGENSCTSGE